MPIRPLSVTESTTTSKSIALCPPSKDFDKDWFRDWLERGDGRKYLSADPTSEEGQLFIANFHGIDQEWNKWLEQNEETSIAGRIDGLLRLINDHCKEPRISLHFIEGKHRLKGFVNAELDAAIDPRSAEICAQTLNLNEMQLRLVPHEKTMDQKAMHQHNHDALMRNSKLFQSSFSVKIHAVTSETASANEIGRACIEISRAISRGKRHSAHKKEFDIIAERGREIFHNIQENCLKFEPNFSAYDNKRFDQDGADDALRNYIEDPFDMANATSFLNAYACPTDDNRDGVTLIPPFVPSFNTQSQIANTKESKTKRTPRSITQIHFFCEFLPPLFASHKGVEMSSLRGDKQLIGNLWYCVEHISRPNDQPLEYLLGEKDQNKIAKYDMNLGQKPYSLAIRPNEILGAAKIIVDMACAMLIHAGESDTMQKRKQEMLKMGDLWYNTMKSIQMDPHSFHEKIITLGKFE